MEGRDTNLAFNAGRGEGVQAQIRDTSVMDLGVLEQEANTQRRTPGNGNGNGKMGIGAETVTDWAQIQRSGREKDRDEERT